LRTGQLLSDVKKTLKAHVLLLKELASQVQRYKFPENLFSSQRVINIMFENSVFNGILASCFAFGQIKIFIVLAMCKF